MKYTDYSRASGLREYPITIEGPVRLRGPQAPVINYYQAMHATYVQNYNE